MLLATAKSVWSYRGFIQGNIKREFQLKYRNSILGAAWNIINPLAMIIVYTVIFSKVMHAKLPGQDSAYGYSIYLCAGTLTWGLFSEIVGRGQTVFLENANILKKVNFPHLCLPVTVVANAILNFSIIFGLFSIFLIISGKFPGLQYIALIPILAILILFAIGLGVTLGVLNVFFRDVGQFFGIFLQFWFWLTPIVYPVTILPQEMQNIITLNPLTGLIGACQVVLTKADWPQWSALYPALAWALCFCALGFTLFRRHAAEMVDEL